jgi:hypothetical protein
MPKSTLRISAVVQVHRLSPLTHGLVRDTCARGHPARPVLMAPQPGCRPQVAVDVSLVALATPGASNVFTRMEWTIAHMLIGCQRSPGNTLDLYSSSEPEEVLTYSVPEDKRE